MTPDSNSIAQEKARQQLLNLKSSQETILSEIITRDGSMKQRILELAQVIEQRIELLDPDLATFELSDISSIIAKELREKECSIANWVRDYLPAKYKNPNLARIDSTIHNISEIGAVVPRHLPEECSSVELELLYETNEKAKNELDNAVSRYNKEQEKIESIAQQRGLQLGGYKFRREISHTDFSEDVPEALRPYIQQVFENMIDVGESWLTIAHKYRADPPLILEEILEDIDVTASEKLIMKGHKDFKMTGDLDHSMERQYISDMNGKHAAGNSDKFPTKLCKHCSITTTYDPDDFEVMRFDHTSPTNYRCAKCGGVDVIERGMSREQVGDRAAFIVREAQNLVKAIPKYGITLQRWSKKYVQPKEDSRKTVIAQFFADSSMSGVGYKVVKSQKK